MVRSDTGGVSHASYKDIATNDLWPANVLLFEDTGIREISGTVV
jgi:hypothetical protein